MKRQKIFALLALCVMVVIFWFSSRDGSTSQAQSNGFIYMFLSRFLSDGISAALSNFVRKCAHFSVYALLGAFVCGALVSKKPNITSFCLAEIICMFYAATDEIHQYFVPGRACRLFDVALDSLGALFGIAVAMLICFAVYKRSCKKQEI